MKRRAGIPLMKISVKSAGTTRIRIHFSEVDPEWVMVDPFKCEKYILPLSYSFIQVYSSWRWLKLKLYGKLHPV